MSDEKEVEKDTITRYTIPIEVFLKKFGLDHEKVSITSLNCYGATYGSPIILEVRSR